MTQSAQVIRHPKAAVTIDALVSEIRAHLYDAQGAKTKLDRHRLAAGQKLLVLRQRVEAGESGADVNWWEWYATQFTRSRKDAEKLMQMAGADNPEAAHEEEKAKTRERMRNFREEQDDDPAHVRGREQSYDIVNHALNLVAKMDEEQREEFDRTYMEKYHV